jgi:hypothetical protein
VDFTAVATWIGSLFAAAAVVLATIELRRSDSRAEQSRQDQVAERRAVFLMEQLVALADAMSEPGARAPAGVRVRARLLPPEMVPTAGVWVRSGQYELAADAIEKEYVRARDARAADGDGRLEREVWVRERIRDEIDAALDRLLSERQRRKA